MATLPLVAALYLVQHMSTTIPEFKDFEIKIFANSLARNFKIIKTFISNFFPGYYGISMSATGLGGNIFVSFILLAMIEIPSYVFNILVMDHWGRKPIFVSSLLLTGVACISAGFLDDGAGKTVLALIGTGFTI